MNEQEKKPKKGAKKKQMVYREIKDPMEDIVSRYLSRENQPSEDALIAVIDYKYRILPWQLNTLYRQGFKKHEIMQVLGIGEMAYEQTVQQLRQRKKWKEYKP